MAVVEKEDLGLKNHLSGLRRKYLKVSFATVQELMDVRRELLPAVQRNRAVEEARDGFDAAVGAQQQQRSLANFVVRAPPPPRAPAAGAAAAERA